MCLCHTDLSVIKRWIVGVVCEEEHVNEVDEYTWCNFGLGGSVGNPLVDHHKHQVAKETEHEEQLWDQHKEHFARLAKVPGENNKQQRHVKARENKYGKKQE